MASEIDAGAWDRDTTPVPETPPAEFTTFSDFVTQAPLERLTDLCASRANRANRARLVSGFAGQGLGSRRIV
ncbi:MAG TPA: hypothetical protein VNW94_25250 [Streptosporangiaceae bacterium]|nr:hypothetical protein [Streptosporangiaceae bacterium]